MDGFMGMDSFMRATLAARTASAPRLADLRTTVLTVPRRHDKNQAGGAGQTEAST
jgi:hypothetical protein